jgi:hypothetical protein
MAHASVFDNEHYAVFVDYPADQPVAVGYVVINKEHNVPEFRDAQIANAISYAEHGHSFLKNKLWRLVGVQGQSQAEFLDKQDDPALPDDIMSDDPQGNGF